MTVETNAIWAIVLAAGESSRMNEPKLVLPFRGRTVIENVVCNILDSGVSNIMIVTGAWEKEVLNALRGMHFSSCRNENYKNGMLSSVICGLMSIPTGTEAVIIFQGDQPGISPVVIEKMISFFRSESKGIVIPVHKGKRGHPLLLAAKYFIEVTKLNPSEGLRGLLPHFRDDTLEIEVDDSFILHDIDTSTDYQESIK